MKKNKKVNHLIDFFVVERVRNANAYLKEKRNYFLFSRKLKKII